MIIGSLKQCGVLVVVLFLGLWISVTDLQAEQCAWWDSDSNTLHVPCLNLGNTSYWINLGLFGSNLILETFGDNGSIGSASQCASFDFETNILHIPCFSFGNTSYWLDLGLATTDQAIQFNIANYGLSCSSNGAIQGLLLGRWERVDSYDVAMQFGNDCTVIWSDKKGNILGSENYFVDENLKRIYFPQDPLYPDRYDEVVSISSTYLVVKMAGKYYWPDFPSVTFRRTN